MLTGMLTYLHIANTMTNNQPFRCSGPGLAGNRASCVEDTWLTAPAAKSSDHMGVNYSTLVQTQVRGDRSVRAVRNFPG